MPSYRVIPVDLEKDAPAVLALWRRNLKDTEKLEEKFEWHFIKNPCGPGLCWLLEADGEPVGTTSLGLRRLQMGNQEITVGVACDLAVDRKHRFLQPALMLQTALLSSIRSPIRMVYGLPNPGGAAVLKRVGYQELCSAHRHAKVLRLAPYIQRKAGSGPLARVMGGIVDSVYLAVSSFRERSGESYISQVIDNFDGRFDELWMRTRYRHNLLTVRDSRFLQWRYRDCPVRKYTAIGLLSPDRTRLFGYLIYYVEDGQANCADVFVDDHVDQLHYLLAKWAALARRDGLAGLSIRCSTGTVMLNSLRAFGFSQRTMPSLPVLPKGSSKEAARALLACEDKTAPIFDSIGADHWYFTPGDQPYN